MIPIRKSDHERIRRICTHETGHYVVGRELSFKTHGIEIQIQYPQGHLGQAGIDLWTPNISSLGELKDYLERRIKVLYAGAIAESFDDDANYDSEYALNEWTSGGSINDYAKIRELVQVFRNISYPDTSNESKVQEELTQIADPLINETLAIVERHFESIRRISDRLFSKVEFYSGKYDLGESEIDPIYEI